MENVLQNTWKFKHRFKSFLSTEKKTLQYAITKFCAD